MDTLNFVMESLACGHTVMGHRDAHLAMEQVWRVTLCGDRGVGSVGTLNFVTKSLVCGHTVMGHRDAHLAMEQVWGQGCGGNVCGGSV